MRAIRLLKCIFVPLGLAALAVVGTRLGWPPLWSTWVPIAACVALRLMSMRFGWNLPRFVVER